MANTGLGITSFGEGESGTVYVTAQDGHVYRLTAAARTLAPLSGLAPARVTRGRPGTLDYNRPRWTTPPRPGPSATARPSCLLYARPGCGLCDETRITPRGHPRRPSASGRPSGDSRRARHRSDPDLERAFFAEIPVVELGGRRLTLAISPARIERLVADVLDR